MLLGLVNGSFYALLSLGLAVIFGLLGIVNFAHGALYMMGAFAAWIMLDSVRHQLLVRAGSSPRWSSASVGVDRRAPVPQAALQARSGLRPAADVRTRVDRRRCLPRPLRRVRVSPTRVPDALQGATNVGFMILPNYRAWVVLASLVVCFATWFVIEKTRLGSTLRAATENAALVQAFGVNVPL